MADKQLKTRISLRRDIESNFSSSFKPLLGEILFVDTQNYGVRIKVGDGVNTYSNLKFLDENNNVVLLGYYMNELFYTNSTYTVELVKDPTKIYIDRNGGHKIYVYDNDINPPKFKSIDSMIPNASAEHAGIMKLYSTSGFNEDGTMTQKAITQGINDVTFAIDELDSECLILDKPW